MITVSVNSHNLRPILRKGLESIKISVFRRYGTNGVDDMAPIAFTMFLAPAQPVTDGHLVDPKDLLLLIVGGLFGLFLAVFVQPLIEDDVRGLLIRIVGHLRIRSKSSLAGNWNAVWAIDGKPLDLNSEMQNVRLHDLRGHPKPAISGQQNRPLRRTPL